MPDRFKGKSANFKKLVGVNKAFVGALGSNPLAITKISDIEFVLSKSFCKN